MIKNGIKFNILLISSRSSVGGASGLHPEGRAFEPHRGDHDRGNAKNADAHKEYVLARRKECSGYSAIPIFSPLRLMEKLFGYEPNVGGSTPSEEALYRKEVNHGCNRGYFI